jgi:hypothetical protein
MWTKIRLLPETLYLAINIFSLHVSCPCTLPPPLSPPRDTLPCHQPYRPFSLCTCHVHHTHFRLLLPKTLYLAINIINRFLSATSCPHALPPPSRDTLPCHQHYQLFSLCMHCVHTRFRLLPETLYLAINTIGCFLSAHVMSTVHVHFRLLLETLYLAHQHYHVHVHFRLLPKTLIDCFSLHMSRPLPSYSWLASRVMFLLDVCPTWTRGVA